MCVCACVISAFLHRQWTSGKQGEFVNARPPAFVSRQVEVVVVQIGFGRSSLTSKTHTKHTRTQTNAKKIHRNFSIPMVQKCDDQTVWKLKSQLTSGIMHGAFAKSYLAPQHCSGGANLTVTIVDAMLKQRLSQVTHAPRTIYLQLVG